MGLIFCGMFDLFEMLFFLFGEIEKIELCGMGRRISVFVRYLINPQRNRMIERFMDETNKNDSTMLL